MVFKKIVNINVQKENRVLFSEQNYFFMYRAYIYPPGLVFKSELESQSEYKECWSRNLVGIGVGIVHKNSVGVGIGVGIVTKMTGVGVGIEKVCWNRSRNH